jgi:hypothetical protein
VKAELRLYRLRDGIRLHREGRLLELRHDLALGRRVAAALVLRPRILGVALRDPRPVGALHLELVVEPVGERLLFHEHVADEPRFGRPVLRLVLAVVVAGLRVRDLDAGGDLVVDRLLDQVGANDFPRVVLRETLLLELLLELLLVPFVALFDVVLDPLVDGGIADVDAEIVGLDLELRALHEEANGLVANLRVLLRTHLRERLLLRVVTPLRVLDEVVVIRLRNRAVPDHRDGVGGHVPGAARRAASDR